MHGLHLLARPLCERTYKPNRGLRRLQRIQAKTKPATRTAKTMKTGSKNRNIVVACRLQASTYNLLQSISELTKVKKSRLIKAALQQWLMNTPEDLPVDLRAEITRANMSHIAETIKNIRWSYHQARNAQNRITELNSKHNTLPPHTQAMIEKLEQSILALQSELDTYLKNQYKGTTQP